MGTMSSTEKLDTATEGLRILTADEDKDKLLLTGRTLEQLGHEVLGHAVRVDEASELIARDDPDLSVIVVHHDEAHALELIEEIAEFARGPVLVLLDEDDGPAFITQAAQRGIYAFAHATFTQEVQGAIELSIRRHAEHRRLTEQVSQLEGALERRAVIERAKGILMERHTIGEREAFELMRAEARSSNRRVVDLASAVTEGHSLLPRAPD